MAAPADCLKVRYLNASALVKLYVPEEHSERLRAFMNSHQGLFRTTSLSFAEALNVFKRKWSKDQLSPDQYLDAVHRLTVDAWGRLSRSKTTGYSIPFCRRILTNSSGHKIDKADVLQLLTILRGAYSGFVGESASVLITADKGLATAAAAESVRVWNCAECPPPSWA